jgi:hypothetical protein
MPTEPSTQVAPCLIRVVMSDGQAVSLAVAEGVSAGGALLLASDPGEPGEVLVLHPSWQGRRLPFRVLICEELADGGYLLAGTFVPPLSGEEVRGLAGG